MKGPSYIAAAAWPGLRVKVWRRRYNWALGRAKANGEEAQRLRGEVEQERVRLAGCGVAALGGTSPEQIVKQGDYGYSASYQSTLELRQKYDEARRQVEALCKELDDSAQCTQDERPCSEIGTCIKCWLEWALAQARKGAS